MNADRKRPTAAGTGKRTTGVLVAILAVGAATASLYFGWRAPTINLDAYTVLGAVTAEETAQLLGNKGKVLVMVRDTGADKNPSVEAELQSFQQALKKRGALSVAVERIPVTPMLMMATGGGVPPEQLFKALQTHPNLGALVLFFGFPPLAEAELEALKNSGVRIVVVSAPAPGYRRLLERQAIQLAIVPRPEPPATDAQTPRTLRERFDQQFAIITQAEAARLP